MKIWKLLPFCLSLLLLLAGCGGEETTPLPPAPTQEEAATVTTVVTAAVADTAATLPPPPTIAPAPTTTPPPAAVATATPAPVLLFSAADFGSDRNRLTGELMADATVLQRRPLAIKLSNSPATYTRPQAGLNDTDIVFEHTTEGNITRFTAIVYGDTPPAVGPIRSARLIDVELPAMYDAALVFSGASVGVSQRLNRSDFFERIIRSDDPGYYRTGEDIPFEHTFYGTPERFWQSLAAKGLNSAPNFTSLLSFSSEAPAGGSPASEIILDYDWTVATWRYDAESGRYLRWSDDEVHADKNSGEQVTAANVIVISPIHVFDAEICEEIRNGTCAHLSVQIQIWGSGAATVFRDGQRYDVIWHRENRSDMLTFTDSAGDPFPLQIGNSWVQVVPTWFEAPLTVNP